LAGSISIRGMSFQYPNANKIALEEIDLEVSPGQMIMVMGASGAGKSTLANTLNGLIPHFIRGNLSGTVCVGGIVPQARGVGGMAEIIGLVFQDFETQLFSTRLELEIAFGMENRGMERSTMQKQVGIILAAIGLKGFEQFAPAELSGGQKQRLAIGAVLAASPQVLCLDEPTTDLDPIGKMEIFSLLRNLRTQTQWIGNAGPETIIVIEHETEEAIHADRIIVLEEGRIVAEGTPAEILADVALFDRLGLQPLAFCDYFHRCGFLADVAPLTLQDAEKCFHRHGLSIDDVRNGEVKEKDTAKAKIYGEEIIRVEELTQAYAEREVLKGINWRVKEREFIAVLGANGSGKTTLVKHLNGLLRPKRGNVYLDGRDTGASSVFEMGQIAGYVFQNPDQQIFCDTVYEEISYALKLRGFTEAETTARVREALDAVGLTGCEAEDPFSLSKGQRQRVAVASILALKPRVIILDEPTTGLDYKDQRRMMELVKRLNEAGHTIIMITHTMWVVAEYAHRVVLMRDGKIIADGGVRDIFAAEATLALADVCPPQITQLGNRVGVTALSVDELLYCTCRKAGQS